MNITKEPLPVNKESNVSIRRGRHGKENPYVMISRKLIQNKDLSLKSKMTLIYLLSLPEDWVTHPKQLALSLGVGKDLIYKIFNELIEFGYAKRISSKDKSNRFNAVEYLFFEDQIEIKENIPHPCFPDTEFPDTENQDTTKYICNTKYILDTKNTLPSFANDPTKPKDAPFVADVCFSSSKIKKEKKMPRDYDPKVQECVEKIISILKNHKLDWIPPKNLMLFYEEITTMLFREKRSELRIYEILKWILQDNVKIGRWYGWGTQMFDKSNACKYLRENFDKWDLAQKSEEFKKPKKLDLRKLVREKFPHGSENNGVFCYHDGEQIRFERGMTGYDLHDKTVDYEEKLKIILDRFKLKIEDL